MFQCSDNHLVVRSDDKQKDHFKLYEIRLGFSEVFIESTFTFKQVALRVDGYGYDYETRNVILLLTNKKKTGRVNMMQISSIDSQKTPLWLGKVTNKELIGRIKSNLFTFINGHIYFNNRVIKCRYDLLEKKGLKELEEDQVFDYFEEILLLEQGELVKMGMPLSSQ